MKRAPRTLSEIRAAFVAGDHEGVLAAFADLDVLLACCRVGDRELLLPSGAVVAHRPGGPLHVAGVSPGNRVELYHGGSSHETLAHRELTNGGRPAP